MIIFLFCIVTNLGSPKVYTTSDKVRMRLQSSCFLKNFLEVSMPLCHKTQQVFLLVNEKTIENSQTKNRGRFIT